MEIKGISDEVTTCECCGKTNLKRTVVIQMDGEIVHYGVDCARKSFRFTRLSPYGKQRAMNLDNVRTAAHLAYANEGHGAIEKLNA